jgi:hypothetical protein
MHWSTHHQNGEWNSHLVKSFFLLFIQSSAADPMNCLFSNSLSEDPAAAAVSFDVTGAVGSYVTPNIYQCDPSTNSYGGMASSSESVGVAYDSITNQIDLTNKGSTIDIFFVLLLAKSMTHRLVI